MSLRLLVSHPDAERGSEWQAALSQALPGVAVETWRPGSPQADYAVGWAVPPSLFATQSNLKAFFCAGAGVDDLLASRSVPEALPILRVEDAGMGEQMADYCTSAVLDWFTHRDDYAAQQAREEWRELLLERRADWPLGVFGQGALGRAVADRFTQLGFPVHGCTRSLQDAGQVDFTAFLRASRVLILLAPLTARTRGLFDAERLSQLPRGAYLINVSRGPLVVEAALLDALDRGHLAGASLDVFDAEPLPAGHRFWRHPRIKVTPHIAAFTVIGPAVRQIVASIRGLEAGCAAGDLTGFVRRDLGY